MEPNVEGQTRRKRGYAQACMPCRERKIKCEGSSKPPCNQCMHFKTPCVLADSSRPVKRARAREGELSHDVERRLAKVEKMLGIRSIDGEMASEVSDVGAADDTPPGSTSAASPSSSKLLAKPRYALGSSALPVYYGETSMHDDPDQTPAVSPSHRHDALPQQLHDADLSAEQITATAQLRHKYVSQQEGETYMNSYFTWASPCYNVVYRPLFMRDMARNGPYFSQLLLVVIYLTGVRFTIGLDTRERDQKGERFLSIAMSLLSEEMLKPSSIPTIQACLGLAGRQSAVGNTSSGWLLTGMAIKMIQDMGIHLAPDDATHSRFSAEELEMRHRVYWSAYCWDKTISLTLGREPSLLYRSSHSPDQILDESYDVAPWRPYFPEGVSSPVPSLYPPTSVSATFVFRYSCRLNIILESVLTNMYSPDRPNARSLAFAQSASDQLSEWYRDLPASIKIDGQWGQPCPPVHITLLNLFYHVIRILLYRPLLTTIDQSPFITSDAIRSCREAALGAHHCIALWVKTFGHVNFVYLMMYCCFVATGADVLLLRVENAATQEEALNRVHTGLEVLQHASAQGPGIRHGIGIISAQLARATRHQDLPRTTASTYTGSLENHPAPLDLETLRFSTGSVPSNAFNDPGFDASVDTLDIQNLLSLLGQNPIQTNDPFAFGSDQLWEGWSQ